MKQIYSFDVKREVVKEVPHIKKTKEGPVETTKKTKKTIKNRVIFYKPSIYDLEDADFFYGQKYNEYINAGFLTKAMLAKKMGDLGGMTSENGQEYLSELVAKSVEAARVVEFFDGSDTLDEEQKNQLEDAKKTYAMTTKEIQEIELGLRSQFSQTADAKAEQKLIEWLVLSFTSYEDQINKEDKEIFPLFEGENYDEKRAFMLKLQEEEDTEDPSQLKIKTLYESSFETLIRVASIWYNKLGDNQETVEKALEELFGQDENE